MLSFLSQYQLNLMLALEGICGIIAFLVMLTKNLCPARKFSIFFIEVNSFLLILSNRLGVIYIGQPGDFAWWISRSAKFGSYLFALTVIYSFNVFLCDLIKHECGAKKIPLILKITKLVLLLGVCVLIVSQFTGFYYTFDDANNYHRGSGRTIAYLFSLVSLALQLICVIQYYKKIPRKIKIPIMLFIIIPCIAVTMQGVWKGLYLGVMTTVGMSIVLYVFIIQEMNEEVERAHKLEVELLKRYKKELEHTVEIRTHELKVANQKAARLLLNILPSDIARELTEHPGHVISKKYPNATVLFTDIVGFTKMSSLMSAEQTVTMLNKMVSIFDDRAKREGIEKIKTIGDAYMAATGLTENSGSDSAVKMIRFAKGLIEDVKKFNETLSVKLEIRIGINSGELVAGVIGKTKFIYDVWGDTVNVASRMESTGDAMRVHVSEATYIQTKDAFSFTDCVKVEVKGKGEMNSYYV
ncbi:adenylate/guanylate cyclase domain-containing protein [Treponema sp.]|uniref:adenylate/guanylate cyclase domain-containing protein n=1 Tax=Treponema sp. TaxID=166 RepID=UPI00298DF40D|nr:adenylate/guanylate cyclase domain-containing protein [Treponema sp.]MCR5612136.1 adenylate/guanylate cyclase domain-containing protein [Treponema sp.]